MARGQNIFQGLNALVNDMLMPRSDDQLPAKRHSLKQVETYEVECSDFNNIEREATGIGTAFACATACLPVAVTLNVTLKTVPITDLAISIPIWSLMWTCYILGAFFSLTAFRQRGRLKRLMEDIRNSQLEPVAAKSPSEVLDLTPIVDPASTSSSPQTPEQASTAEEQ